NYFRSSYVCATVSADYYWSLWGLQEEDAEYIDALPGIHLRSANRILNGCLKNGGLYIKLGQGLVVLDHILPKEYIQTLRTLQDKCLTRKKGEVFQLFIEDFGRPLDEIFEYFDEEPIAAASLAQVFKARTKDGQEVAVKAQYIDLQDRFVGDVTTVKILLTVAGWLFPDFDFVWVLNELRGTLEKELNFLNEGKNSEHCAEDLAHMPYVYVPKVLWEVSSKRVLTTEFIDGIKISNGDALKDAGFSLADIDMKLFKAFSEQIFHTGFVHADPHAGNILIRKGKDKKAQLVILDHGLYEEVPKNVRESLRDLWKSIVLNDHASMKKHSMELGVQESDYRLFCIAIGQRYIRSQNKSDWDADAIRTIMAPRGGKIVLKNLTDEERTRLQVEIIALRNRSLQVFKSIPGKLMLVTSFPFRNINTIRSIAHGHGDPVDRYKVMARCATQGAFAAKKNSIAARISGWKGRIHFEFRLW
ncbi:hypothetical protein AAG570_012226, partial [Ranatra chinensis]